jgi:hypothetical protein
MYTSFRACIAIPRAAAGPDSVRFLLSIPTVALSVCVSFCADAWCLVHKDDDKCKGVKVEVKVEGKVSPSALLVAPWTSAECPRNPLVFSPKADPHSA